MDFGKLASGLVGGSSGGSGSGGILRFPASVESDTYFIIKTYEVGGRSVKNLKSELAEKDIDSIYSPGTSIYLPIPTSGLADSYSLKFDDAKTNAAELNVQGIVESAARSVGQATGTYDFASMLSGRAIDPNLTPLFKGINLRSMTFTWDLIARSESDVIAIRNICSALRHAALPSVEGGEKSQILGFPSAFGLDMIVMGNSIEHNPSMPRLKGASTIGWICESIQFSYNGGSTWYNYITGDPTQVTIVMSFKERTKSNKGKADKTDWSSEVTSSNDTTPTNNVTTAPATPRDPRNGIPREVTPGDGTPVAPSPTAGVDK
jgi:hypothetical protein